MSLSSTRPCLARPILISPCQLAHCWVGHIVVAIGVTGLYPFESSIVLMVLCFALHCTHRVCAGMLLHTHRVCVCVHTLVCRQREGGRKKECPGGTSGGSTKMLDDRKCPNPRRQRGRGRGRRRKKTVVYHHQSIRIYYMYIVV